MVAIVRAGLALRNVTFGVEPIICKFAADEAGVQVHAGRLKLLDGPPSSRETNSDVGENVKTDGASTM